MNVCPVCGTVNPTATTRCLGCAEPLDQRPESGIAAEVPPLPPLPDGGLAATMPGWLRSANAASIPTSSLAAAALSARETGSTDPPNPYDPATFLTADDLPAWLRTLGASHGPPPPDQPSAAPATGTRSARASSGRLPTRHPTTPRPLAQLPEASGKSAPTISPTTNRATPLTTMPDAPDRQEPRSVALDWVNQPDPITATPIRQTKPRTAASPPPIPTPTPTPTPVPAATSQPSASRPATTLPGRPADRSPVQHPAGAPSRSPIPASGQTASQRTSPRRPRHVRGWLPALLLVLLIAVVALLIVQALPRW